MINTIITTFKLNPNILLLNIFKDDVKTKQYQKQKTKTKKQTKQNYNTTQYNNRLK